MSSFQQRRCGHCSDRYTYQASGWGSGENNDGTYCPSCMAVILEALRAVPRKKGPDWVGTSDATAADLEEQNKRAWEDVKEKGFVPVRRVLAGLFDICNPNNQHCREIIRKDGRTYSYEYWTLQGGVEAGHVFVEVERDLVSGEISGPWSLSDQWRTTPTFVDHPPFPPAPPPTHEFVPTPLTSIRARRFDLIESQSLPKTGFSGGDLPDGALPIYDKDPEEI